MIQANELRIGNTLTHQNRNGIYLVTVTELLKNGVTVKAGMQLGEWFLRYDELKGTPLNEELLLKFRFKYKNNGDDFDTYSLKSFEVWEHDEGFCHSYALGGDVPYVHTIQNLFYAITGSELVLPTVPASNQS